MIISFWLKGNGAEVAGGGVDQEVGLKVYRDWRWGGGRKLRFGLLYTNQVKNE